MTEERCECCDLPSYSCGRAAQQAARSADRAERAAALAAPGTFPAQFAGPCPGCGERLSEGDPIRRDPARDRWAGALCCAP